MSVEKAIHDVDAKAGTTTLTTEAAGVPLLDARRLQGLDPYEIIVNPAVGQEYRFLERGFDAHGEFLRAELRYRADATSFTEHIHPKQDETFRVLTGELIVALGGEERSLTSDEQVTLPAGVPHLHRNADGIETSVLWEVRPPMAGEALVRGLAILARDGKTDAEGTPNLLPLAVFLDAHPDLVYLSTPPIAIQKLLFRLLAPIGRRRGYTAEFPAIDSEMAR